VGVLVADMNVCLINLPSPFLLDERVFLSLGILKVASSLESRGYNVDFLDLNGVTNYLDVLRDYMSLENSSNVFGLTATTPQTPYAYEIAGFLKEHGKRTILGGPHITLMHSSYKMEIKRGELNGRANEDIERLKTVFDVLVCGDGELAIFDALTTDEQIIDADVKKSEYYLKNSDLEEMPFPARHLIDMPTYKYGIDDMSATSLIAQLGCPFHCAFCSGRNSPFLRNIRTRSTENICREVEELFLNYNYQGFMFYDDELNVSKTMVDLMVELRRLQDKHNTEFRLRGFIKSELFNEEQAEAMYDAGFRWMLVGFESGDEQILYNIKKNATVADNTRCLEIAKKHNLKTKALMSVGHAGESAASITNTKNWLLETKPEDFDCSIITTYPGSPYFDNAVKEKDYYVYRDNRNGAALYQSYLNYEVDQDYYKGVPGGGYTAYVWTDHLSSEELVIHRDILENEVREKLDIKYNPARPGINYEHSMGMGNVKLPDNIFRRSS
jgi:anaerobic magnesium-protoporphyrin IX monomethyl ester cyclase